MLVDHLVSILSKDPNFAPHINDFKAGMDDAQLDENARIDWKYACSMGTSGTPTAYINRVALYENIATFSLNDWQNVINPLLQINDIV